MEPEDPERAAIPGGYRIEFPLDELHRHIHDFAFIPGYQQHRFEDPDPINLKAVGIMDDLHDALKAGGYSGHKLERLLVRILFCLFAQSTGIFEPDAFRSYIEDRTKPDGTDVGITWRGSSTCSNTRRRSGKKNLDETLAAFPYVNGELFAERLGFAALQPRHAQQPVGLHAVRLVAHFAGHFRLAVSGRDGAARPPADRRPLHQRARHPQGHPPLFLDALRAEFERVKGNKNQLKQFHQKLAGLRFLDPACGCGNFLVIAYRELRLLEIEVLLALQRPAAATRHRQLSPWSTWTPSTASRSASGRRGSPKWPCG